jgi:protein-S-isoprenylcysteine O-methyltransferase Ste14
MRNPIRLKNLRLRFVPFYVIGLALLVYFPPEPVAFVAAALPIVLGLGLRSWGAGHLVKNAALTTTGPYAHMRHPLYAGTILIATGFAILFGGWVAVCLIAAIWPWFAFHYFPRKERIESERLETLYGADFVAYRREVPALWPRWSAWVPAPTSSRSAQTMGVREWALERYSDNNELGTVLAVLGGVLLLLLRGQCGVPCLAG